MQTLEAEGAFDHVARAAINSNFNQLSNVIAQRFFVDPVYGSDAADGLSFVTAKRRLQAAVDLCRPNAQILCAPGQYVETVTIARAKSNLTLVGMGGRGAAYVQPSTEDAAGLIVRADDVTLVNLGVAAEDDTSAVSLTVTGSRFRAYQCKIEAGAKQVVIGPGSIASKAAGTDGNGADALFEDCEFAWGTQGIVLTGTDYGSATQIYVRNCRFHDLSASSIDETNVGGSVGVQFSGLNVQNCVFERNEDGSQPTAYVLLNDSNLNSGILAGCQFPTAIAGGKNLVSTLLLWTSNFHTGGVSTGQPS